MGKKRGRALSVMVAGVLALGIAAPASASFNTRAALAPRPLPPPQQLLAAAPPTLPSPFAASVKAPAPSLGTRLSGSRTPPGPRPYFGARYYGSKIGRFTTTDPVQTIKANLVDPQRWNRYAYVRNNPLRYVDPDGRATLPANSLQARMLAPPAPLPPGASGWQQALHVLAVVGWALNPGGVMPAPSIMAIPQAAVAAAEVGTTAARASEIHAVLDPIAQARRTTAVLRTDVGNIVAGGARDLAPVQRVALGAEEIAARAPGVHAEVTAIEHANQIGATPQVLTSTRPFCPACTAAIEKAGAIIKDVKTAVWP